MGEVALYSSAAWIQREGEGEKHAPSSCHYPPAAVKKADHRGSGEQESCPFSSPFAALRVGPALVQHSRAGPDVRGWRRGGAGGRAVHESRRSGPNPGLLLLW